MLSSLTLTRCSYFEPLMAFMLAGSHGNMFGEHRKSRVALVPIYDACVSVVRMVTYTKVIVHGIKVVNNLVQKN